MAKQSPLGSVGPALIPMPGEDAATAEARRRYIEAQTKMLEALEARNQFIDPRNLAMAQAFLQPTKSGRFGESIGNVLGAYGAADEAERKRGIDIAQIKMELAAQELGQRGQAEASKQFQQLLGAPPQAAPATQPAAQLTEQNTAQPSPQAAAPLSSFSSVRNMPTEAQIAALSERDPVRGEILRKMVSDYRDRFSVTDRGTFDKLTQTFTPRPGGPLVAVPIPELEGQSLLLSEADMIEMADARKRGDAEKVYSIIRRNRESMQLNNQPGAAKPSPAMTIEERQIATKRREALELERAKQEAETEKGIFSAASAAEDLERSAGTLIQLASNPNTRDTFGILQRGGFLGALGQLGEDALRVGGFNIGIPSIEKAIRTSTGTPAQIRAAELAAAASKTLELNFRRVFYQGQGSVSNMEAEVISQLGGSIKDTPEGVVAKAKSVQLRAQFDKKIANAFKLAQKEGISVRDFKDTDAYKEALREYDTGMKGVLDSIINFKPPTTTAPASGKPDRSGVLIQPGSAGSKTVWKLKNGRWEDTGRSEP